MHGTYIDCKTFYSYANKAGQSSLAYAFNRQEFFLMKYFHLTIHCILYLLVFLFFFSIFLKTISRSLSKIYALERIHRGRQSAKDK